MVQTLRIADHRLEVLYLAGPRPRAPTVVFLHEALGSLSSWGEFPGRLARSCGCAALIYSRAGHGRSAAAHGPRRVDYLQVEAERVLPELLARFELRRPILFGHSDGASIALIYAATQPEAAAGLILEAPHVFVEAVTLEGIARIVSRYEAEPTLRRRLARHHDDVDTMFRSWADIWFSDAFRGWNIEAGLSAVYCPLLLIQGRNDEYGSLAQLDAIAAAVKGPVQRLEPDCGHSPHRECAEEVLAAAARFVRHLG